MELEEILTEFKGCGLYSPDAWDAYLDCFQDGAQLRVRLPAAPNPHEIPQRIARGSAAPAERLDPSISPKILLTEQWESQLRRDGRKIGVISGCFDLVHLGHVKAVEYAKTFLAQRGAAVLCVLTLTDEHIRAKKGMHRPVLNVNERFRLITALRFVDHAMLLDGPNCLSALRRLRPDWYFKTRQDLERTVVHREAELVQSCGGSVEVFPDSISRITSTSELIEKIRARLRGPQESSP